MGKMMSSSILISIIALLIMTICCLAIKNNNATWDCVPRERKALLRFKASFSDDHPSNNRLSSWKAANFDCCTWQGVECDNATGHVVSFDMSGVDLSGTKDLFKVLAKPPYLVELRLSRSGLDNTNLALTNCVNSTLFTNVQFLDLSYNSFEGNSSLCFLHNMTSLVFLDLSYNSLHQKADWISGLMWDKCHLKSLNLMGNQFYGDISVAFKNLSGCASHELENLYLNHNEFNGHLPEELGELKRLTKVDVSYNMLSGPIPSSLGNLRALRELYLYSNQLGGEIPISLGQLSNLERFDISYNSFQGTLSESHFAKLSKLEYINAGSNNMLKFRVGYHDWVPPFHQLKSLYMGSVEIGGGQFPQWLQTQKSLIYLGLVNCSITGTLPKWLSSLMNLTELDLSNNHIEGPIPELPSSLTYLDFSDNMITNHLPTNIGHIMPFLSQLNLARNFINGSIPESLCQMKALRYLDLSNNHLSGNLPDCNWGNLEAAILSSNQLSGAIPNSIGGGAYCFLEWLQLNNNSLTGGIPSNLRNCGLLLVLDVGDNKLSGKLPEWNGNDFLFLGVLRLRNNKFYGDIPSTYCQLFGLQIMDLAHNQLAGNLPHCIFYGMVKNGSNITAEILLLAGQLLDVSLSEGMKGMMLEYTGSISSHLVNLDLSSNHLVGKIPSELTNLTGLIGLNLSHNHLRGTIPRKIGDMSSLESLDLSSNNLHGTISGSLSKLTYLSHLNLSNNNLWGQIPTGPQLQTFNNLSYEGNPGLCGAPLLKKCHTRKVENDAGDDDGNMITDKIYLYAFIISGLATGFWGYFGVLVFKRSWRLALFRHMDALIGKMLGRY